MPYTHEWVEPELFLEHKGVRVYHSYKDDEYDHLLEYHFQVQLTDDTEGTTEDDMHEFDARDLITFKASPSVESSGYQAIQQAIDKGGRQELLPPSQKAVHVVNRCRYCGEIPEDCECSRGGSRFLDTADMNREEP